MLCVKLEFTSLAIGLVFGIFELNKWGGVGGGFKAHVRIYFAKYVLWFSFVFLKYSTFGLILFCLHL